MIRGDLRDEWVGEALVLLLIAGISFNNLETSMPSERTRAMCASDVFHRAHMWVLPAVLAEETLSSRNANERCAQQCRAGINNSSNGPECR